MQSENIIYIGSTYTATLTQVPDNAAWRAVSYLITWYNPQDNNEAAAEQVAVWRLLNPSYHRESWVDVNIDNAGAALASQVSGKMSRGKAMSQLDIPHHHRRRFSEGNPGKP
jgi:hypothetical protein